VNEYIGIAVSFVLAAGIAGAMVALGSTLGKKHPTSAKLAPFECGKDPISLPMGKLAIKFYLTAILFILFDVELVFLYPWAVVYRALGPAGLAEMLVFLGVLMVGFVYAWDNGDARAIYRPHQEREVACGGLNQCSGFSTQYSR